MFFISPLLLSERRSDRDPQKSGHQVSALYDPEGKENFMVQSVRVLPPGTPSGRYRTLAAARRLCHGREGESETASGRVRFDE